MKLLQQQCDKVDDEADYFILATTLFKALHSSLEYIVVFLCLHMCTLGQPGYEATTFKLHGEVHDETLHFIPTLNATWFFMSNQ